MNHQIFSPDECFLFDRKMGRDIGISVYFVNFAVETKILIP